MRLRSRATPDPVVPAHPFEGSRREAACADVMKVGAAGDDSGRVVPGIVLLLLFGAGVFLLMSMAFSWAGAQVPIPH